MRWPPREAGRWTSWRPTVWGPGGGRMAQIGGWGRGSFRASRESARERGVSGWKAGKQRRGMAARTMQARGDEPNVRARWTDGMCVWPLLTKHNQAGMRVREEEP